MFRLMSRLPSPTSWICVCVCAGLTACSQDPIEALRIVSPGPVESSLARGGGDRSAAGDIRTANGEIVIGVDLGEYRSGLETRIERLTREAAGGGADAQATVRIRTQLEAAAADFERAELAFVAHRGKLSEAETTLSEFLARFAPELRWEAQYALRTGDLELVAAMVRDWIDRRNQEATSEAARGAGAASAGLERSGFSADRLAVDTIAKLGALAASGIDHDTAASLFRQALELGGDDVVVSRALAGYAEILRSEGRYEEAGDLEERQATVMRR